MIYLFYIGFLEVNWNDIFDILLVSVLLYQVYKLMRGSVALSIFFGFLTLYLFYLVVRAAQMELLSTILGQFMEVGVLAAIILFQQEIRKFLLLLGKTTTINRDNFFNTFWRRKEEQGKLNLTPIVDAAKSLSGSNTGALIVFSKNSPLKFYAKSGDEIDATVSKRLLLSIFNKYSPLHDGAVIIFEGKIKAARCILPVTEQENLPAELGLRHRAAIGMTEITDSLVLVVSEETGQMSIVVNGEIYRNLSTKELRQRINQYMLEERDEEEFIIDQAKAEEEAFIQKKEEKLEKKDKKAKTDTKVKVDDSIEAETTSSS
ncbi:diadenylate cyclase CdaA [Tunicatimonas pelagia]|uniref:diadenylate cyclase CdaA n=1 Tax=Tunicatimonas pelagia TaxID=931531 RepID=UPI002665961B|nr:diadenylate cyclase CdaA [Tunicatimonas pelagia]WKN41733.1 diadenylate cyclase CdaA [Tunicatimonas pelagia]